MKTKILYEIREYKQQVYDKNFKWWEIDQGYTMNCDVFSNVDYEVIKTFESKDQALKEFKKYKSTVSGIIQSNTFNLREITEYEFAKVKYTYDEIENMEDVENELAEFDDRVIFKRDVEELLDSRLEIYSDTFNELVEELKSLKCTIIDPEAAERGIEELKAETSLADKGAYYSVDCIYNNNYEFRIEFVVSLSFDDFTIYAD